MAEILRMPRMSDTMEEGNIVAWLKKEGDSVEPGDVLAEVETDKATMELESYHEGTLLYIGVKEGPVAVNGILAIIGEKGEDYKAELTKAEQETAALMSNGSNNGSAQKEVEKPEKPVKTPVQSSPSSNTSSAPASNGNKADSRIKASPLAKSMAKEAGIPLSSVAGSGDQGRIIKKDIESYLANGSSKLATGKAAAAGASNIAFQPFELHTTDRTDTETKVSQMRKTIARRLGESKFGAPHFYLTVEINMANAISSRKSINEISPTRVSYNDFIVKASAFALRQHPAINSSWLGDSIRTNGNINIGVAVAVDDGLLVPVIRHADMKTLSQINMEVRALAGKAKDKKLQVDEMQGNTFTISNLGMFDIEEFTAIINPPDSCILAVGSIVEKPIVVDGEIKVGHMMKITLSCDHRVVDGATGAKFLKSVKEALEDPVRMLI